ncbi:acid protease [Coniophora puteana RWD-64-598 SS2]|uniref:Acid protease n=1 Tax=Coniophora puteana (strain RWD-64-598) TaxID=741705 RepID=A0A5M3N2N2_CONPW|nr:acid protease [Coniophora puteana RWD-64-598 SS2]EIW85643.1 acid protease [Coniophora puteana RWD-64-598 SS2]
MPSLAALLPLVALATASQAFVTLPLNPVTGREGAYLKGLPDADRARVKLLKSRASSGPTTVPATNLAYVQYTTSVGVGSPATYYNLVVDTGSSNTFVGTGTKYVRTSTSVPTGQDVNVTYGSGYFSGVEYLDQVTLAPGFVIKDQSIGDALSWADFPGVDGIVGVGPADLTVGTLTPDVDATIPTVMDNALKQGLIEQEILGVSFAPATTYSDTNGALTYGGIDSSLYEGEITYTPLTTTYPAAYYWGINITDSTYGTTPVFTDSTAGIVDTGTTQILLADDYFDNYIAGIPGAYMDNTTGLLVVPSSSVAGIQPLNFTIGGTSFALDAAAQLIPEDQNIAWGGSAGVQYGVVGNLGSLSGEGLDFIVGQKFMERYYAIFDTLNSRVGFALTNHTFSTYSA